MRVLEGLNAKNTARILGSPLVHSFVMDTLRLSSNNFPCGTCLPFRLPFSYKEVENKLLLITSYAHSRKKLAFSSQPVKYLAGIFPLLFIIWHEYMITAYWSLDLFLSTQ